jgi:hypothetical protein
MKNDDWQLDGLMTKPKNLPDATFDLTSSNQYVVFRNGEKIMLVPQSQVQIND